ncbi:hypothetical protein K435DRAFT_657548 [Dendrothele bispora CBS 962.96]|uniref:NAD(P)-binding protein n=1 Tax=Dendrothele bispora (strain CBS 962.96) TaxID=1314807 RepID=A0A4S8MCI6_DENBC|nr:hypothetical protein K435DRAFT_657548 [Dendrothele bispora CBS 962.96]
MRWTHEDDARELQPTMPPVIMIIDLSGKTVIVTGANAGIGFEAAKHLARMNPEKLIIVCRVRRKEMRQRKVVSRIDQRTNEAPSYRSVDHGTRSQLSKPLRTVRKGNYTGLIVANPRKYKVTKDGWEDTLQVNNLAPALLAFLLLPRTIQTAKKYGTWPRLFVVPIHTHFWPALRKEIVDAPQGKILETFSVTDRIYASLICFQHPLRPCPLFPSPTSFSRRFSSPFPLSKSHNHHCRHQPFCLSSLRSVHGRSSFQLGREMFEEMGKQAFTSEEGSRQLVYGAIGMRDEGREGEEKMTGGCVNFSSLVKVSDFLLSEEGRKFEDKVWDECIEILSKVDGRVGKIIAEYLNPRSS